MELGLKGKKALVMGSSSGIGKAIAEALIKEGVQVAICGRQEEKLQKTKKEIGAHYSYAGDLTQKGVAQKLVTEALKEMGFIDILVTNTGGPARGNFLDITESQWQSDFQSLWMSVVESLNIVIPKMKEKKFGRILMVTSIAAKEPIAGLTTSNGFRAGLLGLAKSLCHEYATEGITINLLLPGYTNTDRLKDRNLTSEQIKKMIPSGKLVEPSELGALATFLCSDQAASITGQAIAIDGGFSKGH